MINKYKIPIKTFTTCLILLSTVIQSLGWAFWKTGLGIITSTYLSWGLTIVILLIIIRYCLNIPLNVRPNEKKIYILWLSICGVGIVRGLLVIDNYWTAKALMQSTLELLIPLMALIFSSKSICSFFIRKWLKIAFPLFLITAVIGGAQGTSHFSYSIFLFFTFFISVIPKKWSIIITLITIYMFSFYITDRAQALKAIMSICIAIVYFFRNHVRAYILSTANWVVWIATIVIVVLFVNGSYNIFSESAQNDKGKYTTEIIKADGSISVEDASADTRTGIYEDIIESAIKNDYIWFGRTPARGNDSSLFGNIIEKISGRAERLKNEVCFPNIFTWLGLVGMIIYILFYFQAFILALYKSKNMTIKILACFISFHFFLGWMEDNNRWDNNNVLIWMIMGMCYSNEFRNMTDDEFKRLIISCLPRKIFGFKL